MINEFRLLNDRRGLLELLAEDVALNGIRKPDPELVAEELAGWDGEDLVQFFERELLSLAHETEDHEPGDQVEAGVETEGTGGRHDGPHTGKGEGEDTSEGVVDADSPGHTLLTLDGGEDFSGVYGKLV